MTDLLGGQVDIMCDQTTNTTEQIKGGTIKAYAVTTPSGSRFCLTCRPRWKSSLADFNVSVWHGIYTPKGTPAAVNERLSASLQKALADPDVGGALCRAWHRAVFRRRCDARGVERPSSSRKFRAGRP